MTPYPHYLPTEAKELMSFVEQSAIESLIAAIKVDSGHKGINHIDFHYKMVPKQKSRGYSLRRFYIWKRFVK
jgi:hypothetical protein